MKKRIFSLLLIVGVLFSISAHAVAAADLPAEGMEFDMFNRYKVSNTFEEGAVTFEFLVWLPSDFGDDEAGVIMGNLFTEKRSFINFEIYDNGVPRFSYCGTDENGNLGIINVDFSTVDIRNSEWTHLAFVLDSEKSSAYLYVNGELQDFSPYTPNVEALSDYNFYIGGDDITANRSYFRGKLGSVAVYNDIRTEDEIAADMKGIKTKDKSLLLYYDLMAAERGKNVADLSGSDNDLDCEPMFFTEKEPVGDYAYSFVFVGDTQILADNHKESFLKIYDWIVENKESKKIEFVFGLGDITDRDTNGEWTVAKEGIGKLDGIVPYTVIRGNHDSSKKYNEAFAVDPYISTVEGFYTEGNIDNTWRTFTVGETDYLFLNLDYKPSDEVVDWAASVVEAHPDRKVIITTHAFQRPIGKINADTEYLESNLVLKYENVMMVVSGHHPCDDVVLTQSKGVNGNTVTYTLLDTQDTDKEYENGLGTVALFYFSEDGDTVDVEYYSVVQEAFFKENNQFSFSLSGKDLVSDDMPTVDPVTVACVVGGIVCIVIVGIAGGNIIKKKKIKKVS